MLVRTFCRFFARFLSGTPARVPALFGLSMAWASRRLAERFFDYALSATLCTLSLVHAYQIPHMFPILGIADSSTFPAAEEDMGAFRRLPTVPVRRKLGPTSEVRRYDAATFESRSAVPSAQGAIKFGDTDNSTFFQLAEGSVMAEMIGIAGTAKRVKLDGRGVLRYIARVAYGHSSAIAALVGPLRTTASLPPTIPSPSTQMDESTGPVD